MKEKHCSGALIFNNKNEILLVKSDYKWGEKWVVPGGTLEKNETPIECVKREIKEELGIEIYNILQIDYKISKSKDFHKDVVFHFYDFICRTNNIKIKPNHEITHFEWFKPSIALEKLILVSSTREFIKKV